MAIINHSSNYSTIQVKKDIHFVFGTLDGTDNIAEKIKCSIDAFRNFFRKSGEEPPQLVMNWRDGQIGDWVMSDDYRILQILNRKDHYYERSYNKAVIRTCVATFAVNEQTFFDSDFELHEDRYRISSKKANHFEVINEREELTTFEAAFARRIAKGQEKTQAYLNAFKTKNRTRAMQMSNLLIKQERIQKQVLSDVERIMNAEGVTKDYIVAQYKRLIDDGMIDLKNCSGSVRAALKDLADMAAMMPSKNVQTAQNKGVFEEFDDDILNEIEATEATVIEPEQLPESIEFNDDIILDDVFDDDVEYADTNDVINKAGRSLLS